MKLSKLSGRERGVLRSIDYACGSTGAEIHARTQIELDELADLLSGLCDSGLVEVSPYTEKIPLAQFEELHFDINPSYALELREAMRRG